MQKRNGEIGKIFIICDYRDQFYFSSKKRGASLDKEKLKMLLEAYFSEVTVTSFSEIRDFRIFNQYYVLYHTSEDPGLMYKDYIEDVILTIQNYGGILIPNFNLFRAHHNKIFGDLYSQILGVDNIKSSHYGTFEEYYKDFRKGLFSEDIYVFKSAYSTKSAGVKKLDSFFKKIIIPYTRSLTFRLDNLERTINNFFNRNGYKRQSNNRKKFIIQEYRYSPNGDYRVIIYGTHYYVLHRYNRKNDFRASGSGLFNFDLTLPEGLLDYSERLFLIFNCPYIAFDIGVCNGKFVLYEYQAISMGQYAAENAPHFFHKEFNMWKISPKNTSIEEEIVNSLKSFLKI